MKKIFIVLSLLLTITMSVFLMTACSPAASPETSLKGADNLGDCEWNLVFRKKFPKELTLK